MLQVPNYTLKHPQNKSGPVLVAERSHGEEKSDRNSFWRKSASWSLSEQHQFMKNQHYGLNSKSTQNSIFHAITHK